MTDDTTGQVGAEPAPSGSARGIATGTGEPAAQPEMKAAYRVISYLSRYDLV